MTENDIFNRLKNIDNCSWQRIETRTESGVPDVNGIVNGSQSNFGIEVWVELKIDVPRLKPSQVSWHTRARAYGRRNFVLTFHKDQYWLYRPNKFKPLDKHFTPIEGPLFITSDIESIIPYLVNPLDNVL